ncbi:hypothetical protein MK489_16280 [Myxococcota bacterium]|nr:hypothetical protein [Myxococcota bacterium]
MKRRATEFRAVGTTEEELTRELAEAGFADDATAVSLEELQEFLEADDTSVRANPEFKERLRRKLWEVIRSRRES